MKVGWQYTEKTSQKVKGPL